MAITPLPTPPSRTDPVNFSARADAFLAALPTMVAEFNASMGGESAAALAANIASTASGKGAALVGYKYRGVASAANAVVTAKLDYLLFATDFAGVDPTGATSSSGGIQAILDNISNASLTTAFPRGGAEIYFPPGIYVLDKPLIIKTVNTTLRGSVANATLFQATSGTFSSDTGPDALGKWLIIADAAYLNISSDLYNFHVFDIGFDLNNKTDVYGVLINGGRNTCSIERCQWIRFYKNLVYLGKSSRDPVHGITQGFLLSNCIAIWDGNAGQHTVVPDGEYFVIGKGNENTFFNVDVVCASSEEAIGTGIMIGDDTYQCGGNRIIACGTANFRGAHVGVASVSGFVIGEEVFTSDGYRATYVSAAGTTMKVKTLNNATSKYVPVVGGTITGVTSGASQTILSAVFGKGVHIRNATGTVVHQLKALEVLACGVWMHHETNPALCSGNVVDGGRVYSTSTSTLAVMQSCQFNRVLADIYTYPTCILAGGNNNVIEYKNVPFANASLSLIESTSSTNSVIEYVAGGQINVKSFSNTVVVSTNGGSQGLRATAFYSELFAGTAARVRIENDGDIYMDSAAGKTVGLRENGVLKVLLDGSGRIRVFGLTTAVPGVADALYKDASGFVKIS